MQTPALLISEYPPLDIYTAPEAKKPMGKGIPVERGTITVDENYMTTRPGVFAAGDVVTGAKTVVHAVDGAKKAAEAMIRYMEQGQ